MNSTAWSTRVDLARVLLPYFQHLPGLEVYALTGSTGRGWADDLSDLEVLVSGSSLPTRPQRNEVIAALGAEVSRQFDPPDGTFAVDNLHIRAFQVDVIYETTASIEERVHRVAVEFDTTLRIQSLVSNLPDALAFRGGAKADSWKESLAYGEDYRERAVCDHLRLLPPSGAVTHIERGDVLRFAQLLRSWHEMVFVVICALNHRYFPGWKHSSEVLRRCPISPPDLHTRLVAAQTSDPAAALADAVVLIEETLALVDEHLPEIDTGALRERLAFPPRTRWTPAQIESVIRSFSLTDLAAE